MPATTSTALRKVALIAALMAFVAVAAAPVVAAPGDPGWTSKYPNGVFYATTMAPDGSAVFAVGSGGGILTAAYDAATGDELWSDVLGDGTYDIATAVAVDPDGSVVFTTGYRWLSGNLQADWATVAYDAVTGDRLWVKRYDGPVQRTSYDEATAVAVAGDGDSIVVVGSRTNDDDSTDAVMISYDAATGAKRWIRVGRGGTSSDVTIRSGTVFVVGTDRGRGLSLRISVTALSVATGSERWSSRWGGPDGRAQGRRAVLAPDGRRIYVTGQTLGSPSTYATLAYRTLDGRRVWARRFADGASASGIAISPAGDRVFVTGQSQEFIGSETDYATVAYATVDGERLWDRRYDLDGVSDIANAIATDTSGTVFVTGFASLAEGGSDIATIAYDPADGTPAWTEVSTDGAAGNAIAVSDTHLFIVGTAAYMGTDAGAAAVLEYET